MRFKGLMATSVVALFIIVMVTPFLSDSVEASGFASGDGSSEQPFVIETLEQLHLVREDLTASYMLVNDIDASPTSDPYSDFYNDGAGWLPIGTSANRFSGSFDGGGFVISNLFINRTSSHHIGLFSYTDEVADIKKIGLVGFNVSGKNNVGGLVGQNYGVINQSYASANVINGSVNIGGLVGQNEGVISESYATGYVSSKEQVGGLVGLNYGVINHSYASVDVSGDDNVGGLIGNNFGTVSNSFWDVETSGQFGPSGGVAKTTSEMQSFTTFNDAGWSINDGYTTDDTYTWWISSNDYPKLMFQPKEIWTLNDLHHVRQNLNGNFILMADIDASDTATWNGGEGWQPIGTNAARFNGVFDGQGHTISHLFIDRPLISGAGLFAHTSATSEIKNVVLIGADVSCSNWAGALVGWNRGFISESYANGEVNGVIAIGGLVGRNTGTISESQFSGSVRSSQNYAGGLVGANVGIISESHAAGYVNVRSHGAGGLVGVNDGGIINSHSINDVSGSYRVGGLVGENYGNIIESYANGDVSGTTEVGGLIGYNNRWLTKSYATGDVSGNDRVGGLVGWNNLYVISESYANGDVSGNDQVGGLVGWNRGFIIESYSNGDVNGNDRVGGLVGWNYQGTVRDSFWDTESSGKEDSEGGLGKTTAEMKKQSTFLNWDFHGVWLMHEGVTYPQLRFTISHPNNGLLGQGGIILNPIVTELLISQQPRLEYNHSEALDLSGLVVSLSWSNGITNEIGYDDFADSDLIADPDSINPLEHGNEGSRIAVIHGDSGLSALTDEITVNSIITDILIETQPLLVYEIGASLDLSDLVVNLTWSNGSWSLVTFDAFDDNGLTVGLAQGASLTADHNDSWIVITYADGPLQASTEPLMVTITDDDDICAVPLAILFIFGMTAMAMRRR